MIEQTYKKNVALEYHAGTHKKGMLKGTNFWQAVSHMFKQACVALVALRQACLKLGSRPIVKVPHPTCSWQQTP